MRYVLVIILLASLLVIASCIPKSEEKVKCNLASDCPKGTCPDGYEYTQFECASNNCVQLWFFADPCLNHYPQEAECGSNSGCETGGCSGQLCGNKGGFEGLTTTCDFKGEYSCLKLTKCSCIENKCAFEETKDYIGCMAKFK